MRKIFFDENLYEEPITKNGVNYYISFEDGEDGVVWGIIEKEDVKVIELPLTITENFTGALKLPINLRIYADSEDAIVTKDKLVNDYIEVFIDD